MFLSEVFMKDDDLTQKIIGCAYTVHNTLGPGFLEKVYENALRIELEQLGLEVKQHEPINVTYKGQVVGEYYADLWVDDRVVIELKGRPGAGQAARGPAGKLPCGHRYRLWPLAKLRSFSSGEA
jgi:hypothetical protein